MLCKKCKQREVKKHRLKVHDYRCNTCINKAGYVNQRDWRKTTKGKACCAKYAQKYRDRIRAEVFAHYGPCQYCGTTENLQLDHKNGDGKSVERKMGNGRRRGGFDLYRRVRRDGFPDTFQSLCRQCNIAKQAMSDTEFRTWIEMLYRRLYPQGSNF